MNATAKKLLEDALRLPEAERAELAGLLIDSLDQQVDEDAQSAWDSEVQRRVTELDKGVVKAIPWSEARRLILDRPNDTSRA